MACEGQSVSLSLTDFAHSKLTLRQSQSMGRSENQDCRFIGIARAGNFEIPGNVFSRKAFLKLCGPTV